MGSITKRSGKFRVQIRKKGKTMNAVFSTEEMANIWIRYNEDLIDNMENFNLEPEKYITLIECLELKIQSVKEKEVHKKTIEDFENCKQEFKDLMNIPISEITSDMIREISKEKLNGISRRGGNKFNNTGTFKKTSPSTILRKLRVLAAVFSFVIEKGANLTNVAQLVCNQVKMSISKSDSEEDE